MTRRRFAFWIGFGFFSLAERLRAESLDELAAAVMRSAKGEPAIEKSPVPVHWRVDGDEKWSWYERENFIDGEWRLTGITTPINKKTGEHKDGDEVYLDADLVPTEIRSGEPANGKSRNDVKSTEHVSNDDYEQLPTAKRRARHGRPPSKWLRNLQADEISIWLKTIDVPEAGVAGMTYWEHLTRDHSFDAKHIEGLTEAEQAKLHAAAHYGY